MSSRWTFVGLAGALAIATTVAPVAAQEPGTSPEPSAIARGRALGWGVSGIMPFYLGDVRSADGTPYPYLAPGGGVEGRIFYELAGGIAFGVHGGVSVHASDAAPAIPSYRGAAEARWTIDVGMRELAPVVAVSVGLLVAKLDELTVITGFARALGAVQILLASWAAIEVGVAIEGAVPGDGLADAIAWVTPQVGMTFFE